VPQSQMVGTGVGERNMNSQSRDPPNLRRLDQRLRSVGLVTLLVGIAAAAILNITRKGAHFAWL
jgi:hypothetical protein